MFIDNEIQVAASDEHLYSSTFVKAGLKLNKNKEKAAIIGGGDGGVARECISKGFNFIDWYELDPEVVEVCKKHLGKIGNKATEKNSVKCVWGDAFESIKSVSDDTYDHIFVDLNDDQFCIDLAAKNMDSLVRILKPKGVITAQIGSQDKKPHQVENWLNVFHHHFGNTKFPKSNSDTVVLAGMKSNVIAIDLNEKDVPMEKAIRAWWRVLWKLDLANRPPVPRGFQWWQRSLKGFSAHTLGIDDRFAFINVRDPGNQSRLVALDVSDGSPVWANQFDSDLTQGAILRAGAIIVATEYGDIHKFSMDTGRELWKFKHDSELGVSPVASDDGLIVADKDGTITAFR